MKDEFMPDHWLDDEGNLCELLSVMEDEGRRIVAYKFKNKSHRWEYRIAPESHLVFKDKI